MPNTQSWGRDHIDPSSPEFEALIRAHIGRPYANSVDKQAATWVQSPPLNLLGAYLRPTLTPDEFDLFTQKLARVGVDVNAAPDSVYAFGPRVQPMTWSHEFRHRAVQPEADETENRVLDAYYAGSRKAWKEAVDGWHEWQQMENPDITLEESKKVLLQYLKRRTYSWYTPGSEMKKNYLAGGQQPSGLARTLAALGFPSEDFQAKVVSNAPWMLWAQEEP